MKTIDRHRIVRTWRLPGMLGGAALVAMLAITPAAAQDNPLSSAIDRMFGNRQQPQDTGADRDPDGPTTEQVLRIERLESQIRQLTGQVEQLQYRNQQLEGQLRAGGGNPAGPGPAPSAGLSAPPQAAAPQPTAPPPPLQTQQIGRANPPPSVANAAPPPAASAPGRRNDAFDPSANPAAPGAPRQLGSPQSEPPPVVSADPPIGAPGGRRAGGPLDLSSSPPPANAGAAPQNGLLPAPPSRNPNATGAVAPGAVASATAPPTDTAKDSYDLGYGYIQRKEYAQAGDTLQAFMKKYPTDRRAADAGYWYGESLFQRQRYEEAAQAFLEVSTKHATNAKAPESLLRLAQSLAAMKQKDMSCATLAEVGRKYPKASAGVKQGVEREQKRVRC